MSNGTVLSYIKQYPDVDRHILINGIAKGLLYLHHRNPVKAHRDLRAGNILVTDAGVPRLTDFGLSRIFGGIKGMTTSSDVAGSLRWMSPELFRGEKPHINESSDVWAYGMTVLEIYTEREPYFEVKGTQAALIDILNGRLPLRPDHDGGASTTLPNWLWDICQQCWKLEPTQRPSISEILRTSREQMGSNEN